MYKYHKIQTVYLRDPQTKYKTLLNGTFAKPEFEALKDIKWICTEKIDGTNIRILWDGENLEFRGKSDRAQIPPLLGQALDSTFSNEKMEEVFGAGEKQVCLYGEGYGFKIQSGKGYLSNSHDFILFDVFINGQFLDIETTQKIAEKLEIKHVPVVGELTIKDAIRLVKVGFHSDISEDRSLLSEGLILKPPVELFNRKGERVITKIKHRDFK